MTAAATGGETAFDFNLYQPLGQVSSDDAGQPLQDHLRDFARGMISAVMASEVILQIKRQIGSASRANGCYLFSNQGLGLFFPTSGNLLAAPKLPSERFDIVA